MKFPGQGQRGTMRCVPGIGMAWAQFGYNGGTSILKYNKIINIYKKY